MLYYKTNYLLLYNIIFYQIKYRILLQILWAIKNFFTLN